MKKGFYRSSKVEVQDNYGGTTLKDEGYYIIAYSSQNDVHLFLGNQGNPKWSVFENSKAMKSIGGQVIQSNDGDLKFVLYNPNLDLNIILEGKLKNESLFLQAYYENTPNEIWLEDVFEYIGTGES